MTRMRVLPRRPPWVDALLVAGESTTGLVVAHRAAGGMLPSAWWVLGMATTVFAAGLLMLRGSVRPRVVAPGLIGTQLALHCCLTALAPGGRAACAVAGHPAMTSGTTSGMTSGMTSGGTAHLGLGVPMVAAHVAAGLLATWALHVRRLAVRVFTTWGNAGPRLPVPALSRPRRPSQILGCQHLLEDTLPRRGPPHVAFA